MTAELCNLLVAGPRQGLRHGQGPGQGLGPGQGQGQGQGPGQGHGQGQGQGHGQGQGQGRVFHGNPLRLQLYISENGIKEMTNLSALTQLRVLDLSANRIPTINADEIKYVPVPSAVSRRRRPQ